jgi:hypothetical protein
MGGEIDFPQEGTSWRLVEIDIAEGEESATLTFAPVFIAKPS